MLDFFAHENYIPTWKVYNILRITKQTLFAKAQREFEEYKTSNGKGTGLHYLIYFCKVDFISPASNYNTVNHVIAVCRM